MYIPAQDRVTDAAKINAFIQANGFATLISHGDKGSWASHLPFVFDEPQNGEGGVLRTHMARANEQWLQVKANPEVICIFLGPHSYISPSWYAAKIAVPTWNYTAVHVYGTAKIEDDRFLRRTVEDTTRKYEAKMPSPWLMPIPKDYIANMMKAIVGVSIRITRVEAKFKLGARRSAEDQLGVLAGLERSGGSDGAALARFIRAQGGVGSNP